MKKLERCIEIARAMKPKIESGGKNWHATFAFKKNKLLGIGYNSYKHENLHYRFGKYLPTRGETKNYVAGRHSESVLLKKLRSPTQDLVFVNVRIGADGKVLMSRPCSNCLRVMGESGYKKIIYTTDIENEYGTIN